MTPELKTRLETEINAAPVVLFMKGNAMFPQCGFSATALAALSPFGQVHTVDVLKDMEVREGIKALTNWPTIPQVFIHGKFVGGADIIRDLAERGELEALVRNEG